MFILALDIGTSSVKAAVLETETGALAGPIARVPYELDHPTADAAEVPTERLWEAVAAAGREATRGGPDVQAVGMTVLTPGLVLLDDADRPLRPIWTHLDRRSRQAARRTWAAVGPEFLATVGNRPLPGGITAVSWKQMLVDDPHLRRRVKSFLHVNGWLGLHFTGSRAFDPANACFTGLWNTVTDQRWSERWCEFFEVEPGWLPPVQCGSTTLGTLRASVAAQLNVPAGVPVKLGTADTSSGMLAAGIKPGDLLHTVGTTQVLAVLTDVPRPDPRRLTRRLGVGPSFIHVTHNPVGGVALEWLRETCFRELPKQEFYEKMIPLARERPSRVTLDPPFLGGDRLEIEARRAAFRDLTLATDRLDLLAAVLEAMQRCHRDALAALDLQALPQPGQGRVFLTGGGAEVIRALLPEYGSADVHILEEGALHGVACLFQQLSVGAAS